MASQGRIWESNSLTSFIYFLLISGKDSPFIKSGWKSEGTETLNVYSSPLGSGAEGQVKTGGNGFFIG